MRIALQIMQRQDDVLHRIANVAQKAIAPVVQARAESLAATDGFNLFGDGIKAKIAASKLNDGIVGAFGVADGAAVAGSGAVDFIIEPPAQAVHDRLDVV